MTEILNTLSDALAALVERAAGAVVGVHGGRRRATSGLVWQDGVIVTAEEMLRKADGIQITKPDGTTVAATLAGRDITTDVAVLRADGLAGPGGEPPGWQPATTVRAGQLAIALGHGRTGSTARLGMIAEAGEAWRSMRGGRIDRLIRLDLRLDAAAEGGAVIDAGGRLIGMPVFGPHGRVLVIPTATISRVVPQILEGGSVGRGYLGLGLHRVPAGPSGQGGAIVVSIDPDGPAAAAGLLLGDIVTSWNGESISGLRDIFVRLGSEVIGTQVELGLVRAGTAIRIMLHVGKRPAA